MITQFAVALAIGMIAAAPCAAQSSSSGPTSSRVALSATTGVNYSVGDYGGTQKVEVVSIPATIRASLGQFRVSARMPYLRVEGPPAFIGGGEGPVVIEPGQPAREEVREGFGDLNLGTSYSLPNGGIAGVAVELSGNLRLPTSAAPNRFGSGKVDVSVGADFSLPNDKFTPFLGVGYRFRGDAPNLELRDSFSASVGGTASVGSVYVSASYDYSGASSRFSRASHSLYTSLSRPIGKRLNLSGYGLIGLSEGSADFGTGLLIRASIF